MDSLGIHVGFESKGTGGHKFCVRLVPVLRCDCNTFFHQMQVIPRWYNVQTWYVQAWWWSCKGSKCKLLNLVVVVLWLFHWYAVVKLVSNEERRVVR